MSAFIIGEALVDVVSRDRQTVRHPGGSPMNVAVGLSRLGMPTMLHSQIGHDDNGGLITRLLDDNQVAVTESTLQSAPTSVAHATVGADGAARYEFSINWRPAAIEAEPSDARVVHTGSIAAALEPGATLVEGLLHRAKTTVSFDPNIRPQLMGSRSTAISRVERYIGLAHVVKASDEDLSWLYPDDTIERVLDRWFNLGPALVVVTRGAEGAEALCASGLSQIPSPRTSVVDTIGAGDSFMAGLLAALDDQGLLGRGRWDALRAIDTDTLSEVMAYAAKCAAITVSRAGADPPTRAEVLKTS